MEVLNGKVYRHFKGGFVLVIATAKHSDRDEIEVFYKGLNNGKIYARPLESFVDTIKDANGKDVQPRFRLATEEEVENLLTKRDFELIEKMTEFIEKEPNVKNV